MRKQLTALALALVMVVSLLGPISARAASEANWELLENPYGSPILQSELIPGSFVTPEGESYSAFLEAVFYNDMFFFRIYGNTEKSASLINPSDELRRQPVMVYTESGVLTVVDAIWYEDSETFCLDPEKTVGGMSVSQLIELDLRTNGTTRLWISADSWNGERLSVPILFSFALTAGGEGFRTAISQAREENWRLDDPQSERELYAQDKSYIASGWGKAHWETSDGTKLENTFILSYADGYAVAQDLSVSPVKAVIMADGGGLCLSLLYWGEEGWQFLYNNGADFTTPIRVETRTSDARDTSLTLPAGSIYFRFPENRGGDTAAAEDALISALYKKEPADIMLAMNGWGGRSGVISRLYFTLASEDGLFHDLYLEGYQNGWKESLTPARGSFPAPTATPAPVSSAYSDETVQRLCNDYLNTFNYAVPVCEQLYDTIMNENSGLMDYLLAFALGISSVEALSDFYNAKVAFDGVSYQDLTVNQKNLYDQTKNAVDATRAGQIIRLVERLYQLGLL